MEIKLIKKLINADCSKNILVIGVIHGDEHQGEFLINSYLKTQSLPCKNNLYYIPRLNFNNDRKNKNGVDINRNFPTKNWIKSENDNYFGGEFPNSEIETQFIVKLMNEIEFDAVITIHSPYKIVSEIVNYPVEKEIGYPTPGSFGTYSGIEKNIPTITIEVDETVPVENLYSRFEKLFKFLENEY